MQQLEALIDQHGIVRVIEGIAYIAEQKADHIESNWQDSELAKEWNDASRLLKEASNQFSKWL